MDLYLNMIMQLIKHFKKKKNNFVNENIWKESNDIIKIGISELEYGGNKCGLGCKISIFSKNLLFKNNKRIISDLFRIQILS
jgi:hypothetical protein